MFRYAFLPLALSASLFANTLTEQQSCPEEKRHYRASVRHIERGGIGYDDGYTTFETFFASDPNEWAITPFLDARGHVFNNGKWAANAGIGLRALWGNRAYGINTYYDYRNAGRFNANQIGLGLETLGEIFDFRINGYLPLGRKVSDPYNATFGAFSGHYLLVSQTYQSAMKGADAEFGFHIAKFKGFDLYAAAGPYYFIGKYDPTTWGAKGRVSGTYKDIVRIELSDSYDTTFHNKFQGQIALTFSFGPKSKVKQQGRSCEIAQTLTNRMLQPVERQEIIVIDTPTVNSKAIDPDTGLPYFFVFVDNTSSSDGTYESPYHTLAQAEQNSSLGNILYVFPGDGTTTGMDSGITLQESQKLWGSGISHLIATSQGIISIPPQSSLAPLITNTNVDTLGNAITLAMNNSISGINISSPLNDAIFGADSQSLQVSSCRFDSTTTFPIEATFSGNASVSITNNQFLDNSNGIFLTLNGTSTVTCSNNTFERQTSVSSVPLEIVGNNNTLTTHINNNTFEDNTAGSVRFTLNNVVSADVNLVDNTLVNNGTGSQDTLASNFVLIADGAIGSYSMIASGNNFSENDSNSIYVHTTGTFTDFALTASGNTMSNNGKAGIVFSSAATNFTMSATNNTITNMGDHGISVSDSGILETANITINDNTITDIAYNGIVISKAISTLNFTAQNNRVERCVDTGISFYSTEFTTMNATITGNTINECENQSDNAASAIGIDRYIDLTATISNNTLQDNLSRPVAIGLYTDIGDPDVCLTLSGNNCNTDPAYYLYNQGAGEFNLSPCNVESVNVGTFDTTGTITAVQSCPDATPCPP